MREGGKRGGREGAEEGERVGEEEEGEREGGEEEGEREQRRERGREERRRERENREGMERWREEGVVGTNELLLQLEICKPITLILAQLNTHVFLFNNNLLQKYYGINNNYYKYLYIHFIR